MLALTDNDGLKGQIADLAARVERLEREIQVVRQKAERITPTGHTYRIQIPNPLREISQPTTASDATVGSLAKVVTAIVDTLAVSGIAQKAS